MLYKTQSDLSQDFELEEVKNKQLSLATELIGVALRFVIVKGNWLCTQ